MPIHKLTSAKVAALAKPGYFGDGGNLYLQISPALTKSWIFRFALNGRKRDAGLGPLHTVSLARARQEAQAYRLLLREGRDPIAERDAQLAAARAATMKRLTFREAAEGYLKDNRAGWRSAKHAQQWEGSLRNHILPLLGDLAVAELETGHVVKCLRPLWDQKPTTASRARNRIELILSWAKAHGFRDGENPARWRGHLDAVFAARSRTSWRACGVSKA